MRIAAARIADHGPIGWKRLRGRRLAIRPCNFMALRTGAFGRRHRRRIRDSTRSCCGHSAKLESHDLVALDQTSNRIRLAIRSQSPSLDTGSISRAFLARALRLSTRLASQTCMTPILRSHSPCVHCGRRTAWTSTWAARCKLLSVAPSFGNDFAYDGSAAVLLLPGDRVYSAQTNICNNGSIPKVRREGIRLTIDEALEVGRAIFGPVSPTVLKRCWR